MLKVGVIGLGSMGKNHARVCSEIENLELAGVSDINEALAKNMAEKFTTKSFTDYKQLLREIDVAIVATPTIYHYDITNDLLENGKHVLVEKPISNSVEKAQELIRKAQEKNLVLAVGHIERHNPVVKFVKDSLDRGKFGELITLTSRRVSNFPGRIRDVGVVMDLGIHDIDIMYYLAGEIESVYAKAGKFTIDIDNEDHANIFLNFKSGICGVVEINWLTPMKVRKLFLTCSNNFVEADYIKQAVTISSSYFEKVDETDLYRAQIQYNVNEVALEKKEPLRNEIEDFIKAVENNSKPLASGEDGLMALRIAEAATNSYQRGEEVKII